MSGLTSQPSMGAVCGALEQSNLGTGIRYADIQALNLYWTQVRLLYTCFEANVRASDSSVFDHEMPGGQYTNLMVSIQIVESRGSVQYRCLVPSVSIGIGNPMGRYAAVICSRLKFSRNVPEIKKKYAEANELVNPSFRLT